MKPQRARPMLTLTVRDYRGIERADVELAPIALVAGQNEAGKSSLAEAARAALTGTAIPVPGIAKKDAKLLVRDGAEEGYVKAICGEGTSIVHWPKAQHTAGETDETWSSAFAAGLKHLFDLDDKERANVLAGYIDSVPTVTDLAAAMRDAGYASERAVDRVWQAIETDGWDATHKKAREHTTKLKGQWEGITGEKYGPKKAEDWAPNGHPGPEAAREDLEAALEKARARVKDAVGSAAVSQHEVDRLKAEASAEVEDPGPLRQQLEEARAALAEVEAERATLPAEDKGENTVCECPSCGTELVVEHVWKGPTVLKLHSKETKEKAESKEVRKRRAELDGKVSRLQGEMTTLNKRLGNIEQEIERRDNAAKRLAELGEPGEDNSEKVAEAERAEAEAQAALKAFDNKDMADKLHGDIVKNDKLAAILAPDGLRRRKLAAGLETFNEALATLCAAAKWPVVRLDETLQAHYGTRPLWAASGSGQWRARAVVQVAMAQMDGSAAVVLDEADILDARGRNALLVLLQEAGVRALMCMTINKPGLVPDLKQAGLGASYWVATGIVEPTGTAQVAA